MSSRSLLDVNALVALAWPNHVHHGAITEWFGETGRDGWATCPMTQAGFVRVSSNRRVIPDARSVGEAVEHLRRLCDVGDHAFWSDEIAWTDPAGPASGRVQGYRQVTDAHLVALAARRGGTLVTFDAGARQLSPDRVTLLSIV